MRHAWNIINEKYYLYITILIYLLQQTHLSTKLYKISLTQKSQKNQISYRYIGYRILFNNSVIKKLLVINHVSSNITINNHTLISITIVLNLDTIKLCSEIRNV